MEKYYLAVDIGASSGRHILGHMENGRMIMEEIHRFPNGLQMKNKEACWDLKQLFQEIKNGMKKCKEAGKIPESMGIDTWAVDFVLLDSDDGVIGNTVGYRDKRTEKMNQKVYEILSEKDLYARTGIQKQIFNTIYQLMAVKEAHPDYLEKAESMLMIPDYFHFLLTGKKAADYTNSTTTQLVSPLTNDWDMELIEMLGYPKKIFMPLAMPGALLGSLTTAVQQEVGFDCKVVLPATHDTASAVLAVPSNEDDTMYISSGTWSLMGVERSKADCTEKSRSLNLTNEGGYDYRFRYLKNIMGLWMIQSVKAEWKDKYSFAELCSMAEKESITSIVDCNDNRFLAPVSMIEAVRDYCAETNQQIPANAAQTASVIYRSLALCYKKTVQEIEEMTGVVYPCIHVVGGGANAEYLNKLTAEACGKKVLAGPTEATAIGNLMVQMISAGELSDLMSARACVYESFQIKTYQSSKLF